MSHALFAGSATGFGARGLAVGTVDRQMPAALQVMFEHWSHCALVYPERTTQALFA
jgi:hypothetical protein